LRAHQYIQSIELSFKNDVELWNRRSSLCEKSFRLRKFAIRSDAFGATGSTWGLRAPIHAISSITFEPYYAKSKYKDRDETIGGISYTREGFDGKAFGLNAILGNPDGGGFHFFPYFGIGKTKLERTAQEINKTGFNFGLGLGLSPAAKVSVQVRGEFAMVATGDTSRKFTNATLGLTYSLKP